MRSWNLCGISILELGSELMKGGRVLPCHKKPNVTKNQPRDWGLNILLQFSSHCRPKLERVTARKVLVDDQG